MALFFDLHSRKSPASLSRPAFFQRLVNVRPLPRNLSAERTVLGPPVGQDLRELVEFQIRLFDDAAVEREQADALQFAGALLVGAITDIIAQHRRQNEGVVRSQALPDLL